MASRACELALRTLQTNEGRLETTVRAACKQSSISNGVVVAYQKAGFATVGNVSSPNGTAALLASAAEWARAIDKPAHIPGGLVVMQRTADH